MADEQESEALIHPGDDGKFWAEVVGINGCYAQGDNYTQIMAALRDAHELCSAHPSGATPPPLALTFSEESTVDDLAAQLAEAGWEKTEHASASHTLYTHSPSGAVLALPNDALQLLNAGFKKAIAGYFGSSEG